MTVTGEKQDSATTMRRNETRVKLNFDVTN